MRRKLTLLTVTLTLGIGALCFGTQYGYECKTPGCGFQGFPLLLGQPGPTNAVGQVSGYCCKCRKFVSIQWKDKAVPKDVGTNLPYAPPKKLATVWNPTTGREANLYPCPECGSPFLEIDASAIGDRDHKMSCPRCGKHSLVLDDGP